MSDDGRRLVELDSRRRLSLGNLAAHHRYFVEVEADGVIILTPAIVMTAAEAAAGTANGGQTERSYKVPGDDLDRDEYDDDWDGKGMDPHYADGDPG